MFSLLDNLIAGGWLVYFVYRIIDLHNWESQLQGARGSLSLLHESLPADTWIDLWKEFDTARYGFYDRNKTPRNNAIAVWIFYVGASLLFKVIYYVATH